MNKNQKVSSPLYRQQSNLTLL